MENICKYQNITSKNIRAEYIEIAEKFQPGFKSLLTEDYDGRIGLFAIVPGKCLTEAGEAWMKAKHKPGFFNRMADASVYVRDQNVLSKIEELPVSNKSNYCVWKLSCKVYKRINEIKWFPV